MVTETQAKPKDLILTSVFNQVMEAWLSKKRRAFVKGGTWASKTYSVMQLLKLILENYEEPILATVMSESMPHLKSGSMADFFHIMGDELIDPSWNRTDCIYTFPKSRCRLEFVSADNPGRVTGPRRDILFCNEINNLKYESYWQADMRARLFTICDWNPTSEFWVHDKGLLDEPENVYIEVTYKDALQVLSEDKRKEIESWELKDPERWRVYGLGQLGKAEGLVYPDFDVVDELPEGDYLYGLDFGFASDPCVLTKHVILNDKLYSQELFYDYSGLTNDEIARKMDLCGVKGNQPVYPDPQEPKSMEELRRFHFWIPDDVVKGKGSVEYGIQKVNQYYQHWTKDSLNCIKEQRNYRYLEDREHPGRFTDKTTHQWSHGMKSREYAVRSYIPAWHGAEPAAANYM